MKHVIRDIPPLLVCVQINEYLFYPTHNIIVLVLLANNPTFSIDQLSYKSFQNISKSRTDTDSACRRLYEETKINGHFSETITLRHRRISKK